LILWLAGLIITFVIKLMTPTKTRIPAVGAITIRRACADDDAALFTLAALDSSEVPMAPLLLAEVDGVLRAALSLDDDSAIGDPFFPTVGLIELLRTHAAASEPRRAPRRGYRLSYA
jgi:hypothetical protein